MKKSLLALAVLSAFASAASAQSSVPLSGLVDAGVRRVGLNSTASGNDWSLGGSQSAYNSFTLGGREDLGGGMTAFFTLNHRFNINNGTINSYSNTFWRNSFVGLGGAFGDVRLGRMLMPLQDMNGGFDPWGTGNVASIHTGGITATIRSNNTIYYRSPNLSGLTFHAAIAAAEGQYVGAVAGFGSTSDETANNFGSRANADKNNAQRPTGFAVRYAAGPLNVGLAYDRNTVDTKTVGVYGTYDFGAFKLWGQYEKGDGSYYWRNTVVAGNVFRRDENLKNLSIGVTAPFGPVIAKAGYVRTDSNLVGMDGGKFGLGADYFLSKRTNLYTNIAKLNGDRFAPGTAPTLSTTAMKLSNNRNQRNTQFDIGITHRF